jgi:hypothetical protein
MRTGPSDGAYGNPVNAAPSTPFAGPLGAPRAEEALMRTFWAGEVMRLRQFLDRYGLVD